jgi:probable rRNA maturation factor
MSLSVDIQSASSEPLPDENDIRRWIAAALGDRTIQQDIEISVRVVDTQEMTSLNETYRGNTGPTNVLSFPADLPAELQLPLLGDIVICAPVVRDEARAQGKSLPAHWAHMSIHGTLHLLGYDHIDPQEALTMESLESDILRQLNYPCPYSDNPRQEYSSR